VLDGTPEGVIDPVGRLEGSVDGVWVGHFVLSE